MDLEVDEGTRGEAEVICKALALVSNCRGVVGGADAFQTGD
jgi:hypothetical protein